MGQVFLDWLSPATDQRWIDVGCGNGAFTEPLIIRTWVNYGMTIPQVAEVYEVAIGVIERILRQA